MGQTLSTNSGYFNSIKKKFWSRSTRIAREDFAREKEPEKMGWIRIGGNKWRKHPREEKPHIKRYSIRQKACPEDNIEEIGHRA